jgi:hypothetical protein
MKILSILTISFLTLTPFSAKADLDKLDSRITKAGLIAPITAKNFDGSISFFIPGNTYNNTYTYVRSSNSNEANMICSLINMYASSYVVMPFGKTEYSENRYQGMDIQLDKKSFIAENVLPLGKSDFILVSFTCSPKKKREDLRGGHTQCTPKAVDQNTNDQSSEQEDNSNSAL